MEPVKRIEVVAATTELDAVLRALDAAGVSGYTVIRDVGGRGGRGRRAADDLVGTHSNAYVITACDAERVPRVVEAIRPILERFGGVALVSDALWVRH